MSPVGRNGFAAVKAEGCLFGFMITDSPRPTPVAPEISISAAVLAVERISQSQQEGLRNAG
jgi:hypothetical protein